MHGVSSYGKDKIREKVESLFDRISAKLFGRIPPLKHKKDIYFSATDIGLAGLFLLALGQRRPNSIEEDMLKGLLLSSFGYMESLKQSTISNVTEQVDGLVRQSRLSGKVLDESRIQKIVEEQLSKSTLNLTRIIEAESTKFRNMGSVANITKVAAEKGIDDPNVFFVVLRDGHACKYCIENHLNSDGSPKIFKLSEIKHSFLSTAEKKSGEVSVCGQHPKCRCGLQYLPPGYGFKNGKLSYISSK